MFTLPDNVKVLNLPEQVEKNREDIASIDTNIGGINSEIDYLKHRADDLEKNTGSPDGAIITGTIDAEKKATFGSDVEVDGTLAVNSFDNIAEKTSDGTQTLQGVIDAKQDKLTNSLPQTTAYTVDTLGFDDDGNLQRSIISKVTPITLDNNAAPLDAISIGYNKYRFIPMGDDLNRPNDNLVIGYKSKTTAYENVVIGGGASFNGRSDNGRDVVIGDAATAEGGTSVTVGSYCHNYADDSVVIGYASKTFIPSTFSIDRNFSKTDTPRTLILKSTDNLFFLNDIQTSTKKKLTDYADGKSLTQYLNDITAPKYYSHTITMTSGQKGTAKYTVLAFNVVTKDSAAITSMTDLCAKLNGYNIAASGVSGQVDDHMMTVYKVSIGANRPTSSISRVSEKGIDTITLDLMDEPMVVDAVKEIS